MASWESGCYEGRESYNADAFLGVNLITGWYSPLSDIWQRASKSPRGTTTPFQIALSRRQSRARVLRQALPPYPRERVLSDRINPADPEFERILLPKLKAQKEGSLQVLHK